MSTLKLKSTIKCGACVAKVTSDLDASVGAGHWSVDLLDPNRVLTVEADGVSLETIQDALAKTGYKAELLEQA
jgi:copper chaperone